jgi:cell wall-associated NlpC family hydrolase
LNNDDDLNEENNVENNEPSTPSGSQNGFRNFLKSPARAIGNKAKNTLKDAIKKLWNKMPLVLKIKIAVVIAIAIGILIAALIALSIIKEASRAFTDSIDNFFESVSDTGKLDDNTKSLYKNKGSLIGFSLEQINEIYDTYLKDSTSNNKAKENLQKLFGTNDVENERIVNVNDKIELYKHILLTEKYNFNNIKWKQYGHGIDGQDSSLKEDKKIGLKYPSDQNSTKIDTFIDFTLPYLQTWYIPLSMYSSSITQGNTEDSGMNSNFAYNVLKKAYSDILVNRYDVQKYTLNTKYKEYNKVTKHIEYEVGKNEIQVGSKFNTVTKAVEPITTTTYYIKSSKEVIDNTQYIDERKGKNGKGNLDPLNEDEVNHEITVKNKYFIKEARTFDMIQINSFEYKKYNQSDVNSRKNEKTEVETNTEPYEEKEDIPDFTPTQEGTSSGASFIEKVGKTHYVTRTWEDSLTQNSNESKLYTYDDVISYNENAEKDDDKDTILKDDFEKSTDDVDYYNVLDDKQIINRIDFINSNPKIYKKYLQNGSEYSNYVGYSRSYLKYSYSELTDLIKNMKAKFGSIPFVYGKTLGIDESYFSSGSSGIGGGALSGIGTMVQAAIDLAGKAPWHYCQGGSNIIGGHPAKYGRISFSTMDELNNYIAIGEEAGTDCSAFIWSMYKTYLGLDIAAGEGAGSSASIAAYAKKYNGQTLPGSDNVTVTCNPINTFDELQPGDILYREYKTITKPNGEQETISGHVSLYVGKIDGKYMQVDHGGGDVGGLCNYGMGWTGPSYREYSNLHGYDYYIRYTGAFSGQVEQGDVSKTLSDADKEELIDSLDADVKSSNGNEDWGKNNGAWALQYYKDNPVELIARMITHENSISESQKDSDGANEMVKCQTLIMMTREKANGSVYKAIIDANQFYSGDKSSGDRFNRAPAQWVRELVYQVYNGLIEKPSYWDNNAYYWIGPADGQGKWRNVKQIAGIKITDSTWHVLAKSSNSNTPDFSIAKPNGTGWSLISNKTVEGHLDVYVGE